MHAPKQEAQGKETRRAELRAALGMETSASEEAPVLVEVRLINQCRAYT